MDFNKKIIGYTDRISVVAGDRQQFMISSETAGEASAELVRIRCSDMRARGAGFQEIPVSSDLHQTFSVAHQPLVNGSYAVVDSVPQSTDGAVSFYFYPTLLSDDRLQVLFAFGELLIAIRGESLEVSVSGEAQSIGEVQIRRWHKLEVAWSDQSFNTDLRIHGLGVGQIDSTSQLQLRFENGLSDGPRSLTLAAELHDGQQGHCFNGKLEDVRLRAGDTTQAHWRFELEIAGDRMVDDSGHGHDGMFCHCPIRASRGYRWDASVHRYSDEPSHYGAVYFHEDDLTDAGWQPTLSWTVPEDLPSGQYSLKLKQGDDLDYITFFVRPAPHHRRNSVAYLAPTATYLAYANQRLFLAGAFASKVQNENDAYLRDHIEVGPSLYEHHSDGSGVHYSSYLRPVTNLKAKGTMWAFNADTNITDWLEEMQIGFDVITDEDLHREGESLLANYQVVITGTHPEYYSVAMLDGIEGYLGQGGRLMYMGGNGFYWKIAYHPDNPAIIEVRRAEGGTRAWMAEPGEYYQSFDGELGGMWRRNGRPPNQVVGVGFAAQGFDGATHYRVTDAAGDPRVAFMFEGTSGSEIIGNYGSVEGGAAGQEIDRWDPKLGSPPHALVVATSEHHNPGMLRVVEEMPMSNPFMQGPLVRADMTFFETPSGGAVFSTGSISYAGSLAHNRYDNDICRITTNVVKRFSQPEPFDYPI